MQKNLCTILFILAIFSLAEAWGRKHHHNTKQNIGYVIKLGGDLDPANYRTSATNILLFQNFASYLRKKNPKAQTCIPESLNFQAISYCFKILTAGGASKIILLLAAHGLPATIPSLEVKDSIDNSSLLFDRTTAQLLRTSATELVLFTCYAGSINRDWFPMPIFGASSPKGRLSIYYIFKTIKHILENGLAPESAKDFHDIFSKIAVPIVIKGIENNHFWFDK